MEKYESKQVRVGCSAQKLYELLSDFNNFSQVLNGQVQDWQATKESCSFKIKGFNVGLKIIELEPFSVIKITGDDGSPFEFYFWIQLKEVAPDQTQMRLVLHAKLNMMLKMMVGSKIQGGLDQLAQTIADGVR